MCRPFFLACRLPVFPSWVVFLVSGLPCLAASPPDGSRFGVQGGRLQLQGSCFQSLFRSVLFFSFRACRVSPQVRWMAPVSRCRVPLYGRRGPASNLSVPVSRGRVPFFLCRAPLVACRLLVFPSWIVFFRFGRAASRRRPAGCLPFRVAGCPLTAAGVLLPILVCLFPVAVCLFPFVGLFFLLVGSLFFRPVLFFSFRACRVSPQARWMAPVSRCRVPVYG